MNSVTSVKSVSKVLFAY